MKYPLYVKCWTVEDLKTETIGSHSTFLPTASLNCSVRIVANNGTLDCDLMGEGVTTTDCFLDGDMPLTCESR